jgi:hypothetical protein
MTSTSSAPRLFGFVLGGLAVAAVSAFQPAAEAGTTLNEDSWSTGWDWDGSFKPETYVQGDWRTPQLDWAQKLDFNRPSFQVISREFAPPPREPWCSTMLQPLPADCANFNLLLGDWARSYLNLEVDEALPASLPVYPRSCPTACPNL